MNNDIIDHFLGIFNGQEIKLQMENTEIITSDLNVDHESKNYLAEAARWAKFLGIIGFVACGLVGLALLILIFAIPFRSFGDETFSSGLIFGLYFIVNVVGFLVALFTYRFGTRTIKAISFDEQVSFQEAMLNLRLVFRVYGILAIIYLILIGVAFLAGIFSRLSGS